MTVPTVRVANPRTATGYMTINAADYRELVHGPLWHEQEPGFSGRLPPPEPVRPYSSEESRRAANLLFEFIELDRERTGEPTYASLSAQARLDLLQGKHEELQQHRAERLKLRVPQAPDVVVPDGVVPGETPGWPLDADTGKPLWLPDEERRRLADYAREEAARAEAEQARVDAERAELARQAPPANAEGQAGTSQPTPPPSEPEGAPSWLRPATEPAQPPATPVAEKTVEKGPGAKWYVMQAGKPVSEGFKTKAEAEAQADKPAAE